MKCKNCGEFINFEDLTKSEMLEILVFVREGLSRQIKILRRIAHIEVTKNE